MKPILIALASTILVLSCNEQSQEEDNTQVKEIKLHPLNNQNDQETNSSKDLKGKEIPTH